MKKLMKLWSQKTQKTQKTQKSYRIVIIVLGLILFFEISGYISLLILGLHHIAMPWTFLTIFWAGFYSPVIVAFLIIATCSICVFGIIKGGVYRWYGYIGFAVIGGMILATGIGLGAFALWEGWGTIPYPWQLWQVYHEMSLSHIATSTLSLFLLMFYVLLVGAIIFPFFYKADKKSKAFGDAHFASPLEIKKADFFSKEGLIIGKTWGKWLRSTGFEHILTFAPTGSGKTRGIAIPNLLTFPYSVVVNDNKRSLFKLSSKYREKRFGHKCFLWALSWANGKTHRYNPLSFIPSDKVLRMKEIQRLAHIMIPDGKGDPIWYQSSRKLFKALVLYLLDSPGQKATLGAINRLVKQPNFNEWLESELEASRDLDPEFYRNGYSYIQNHPKTLGSILETFTGYFELFDDPIVDAATAASDFDFRELRKKKMSIYIGFSDDDMERLAPIITIFWQQFISSMIQQIPDPKIEPYPVLCLIDEFSSLSRIDRLRQSLKLLREYRVRCIIMLQYIAQTLEKYTPAEAQAFTNIKTKIAFALESIEDAEYVSKLLGTKTQKITSGSTNHQADSGGSTTSSYSYHPVPLMRPEEIGRLKEGMSIIIRSGHAPVKATQCIWYKENTLKSLPCGETNVPTQKIEQIPFTYDSKASSNNEVDAAEEAMAKKIEQEEKHQRELEKIHLQTSIMAKTMLKIAKKTHNSKKNK